MQIMQQNNKIKKMAFVMIMILLYMCVNIACSDENGVNNAGETEYLNQESSLNQNVLEMEKMEKPENAKGGFISETAEQTEFKPDGLPEEIKALLSYENWIDGTQALSRTEEDIKNSGMPVEFQQIINGDFSSVQGLRNEEEREELKEYYERREDWAYMMRDMNRDGVEELCMKDRKGRIAIFFEVWGDSYLPGFIEIWSFGEHESNLLTEEDWGANDFFLNNGQLAMIFKSGNENNTYYNLSICCLSKYGTFPPIEEMEICIINDISPSPGYVVNYENPGIYYEIARYEGDEYIHEEVTEQDAVAWCEDNIYSYMMSEQEWYAVP